VDGLARYTMKDVASCDKLRRGASNFWTEDFRMWLHIRPDKGGKLRELKRLSTWRKRNQLGYC